MPDDAEPPRFVFYKEDIKRIASVLVTFLKNSKARAVLLLHKGGRVLTKEGDLRADEMEAISRLVADVLGTTRPTSDAFGKRRYALLSCERVHIQLLPVGAWMILAVVFEDGESFGMIRLYSAEVGTKLGELLDEAGRRGLEGFGDDPGVPVRG
jgi:predicted regulator of Ras-like GTPase activity (Roadblock/LC7/MglB family)